MEFHAIAATAIKVMDVVEETKLRETFLNVSRQQHFRTYIFILILKCFTAAYGMKKISGTVTFWMLLANFIKSCIYEIDFYGLAFSFCHFFLTTPTLFLFHDEGINPMANVMVLTVASLYDSFEFFVDAYVTVIFVLSVFEMYGGEVEKSFTMISYILCLDWLTNYLLGDGSIGMIHAVLLLHIPIFLLLVFIPYDSQSRKTILLIAIGIALWQTYRLGNAVYTQGVSHNPRSILNETLNIITSPRESIIKLPIFNEL